MEKKMLTVIGAATLPIIQRREVDRLPRTTPSGVAYLKGQSWHVIIDDREADGPSLMAALNAARRIAVASGDR